MRGHAEHRADGEDAGAADTGDQDTVGIVDRLSLRGGERGPLTAVFDTGLFTQGAAVNGDETRAETAQTGKVLVTGALIDRALASESCLFRDNRQTVRLYAAVAATLAHGRIDDGAFGRIGKNALFTPAAFFSGTGLRVN
jgi:hypothetical protein